MSTACLFTNQVGSHCYSFLGTVALLLCLCVSAFSQTPVTQYPCDPRSTANGGTCPGGDCAFAANVERGCNCFDNIDNDGDGKIDSADPDCAAYFGLEFVGAGSDCSIVPPGALTPFDLVGPPTTSSNNTSDTQSKVAAGDVDGNGVPDVVITSKWNAEVRLVSTWNQAGLPSLNNNQPINFSNGDIMADFRLSGAAIVNQFADKGYGSGTGSIKNLLFEHEVLIADINKDGKAEVFAVVSHRAGAPSSIPDAFFLVGLQLQTYGAQGLKFIPGYPVWLGPNRPGTFGIADMDGDGKAEVYLRDRIFAAENGKLLASEGAKGMNNTALWDVDVTSAPVAVDIRSAGADNSVLELVCGPKIYKIPNLTNRNPASPAALTLWRDMNSITFDIDGNGVADQYFIKLINDPDEYGVDSHSSTSVADIDMDGFVDVVITGALNSTSGRTAVFYWNVQDNTVTGFLTPNSAQLGLPNGPGKTAKDLYDQYVNGWIWGTGRVNIGDADADGKLDLLFVAGNQLFCFTTDLGSNAMVQKWVRSINDSRSGVITVTIYDFSNDGFPEVVYRDARELAIVDGVTGQTKLWSQTCNSHTYTEGPIIADVNGDGNTDICVACNFQDNIGNFDNWITAGIQQQAGGHVRIYFSSGEWLPTRQVWNQPGYFVVNVNDDLTLPFPQLDIAVRFTGNCNVGPPGERMPFNVFLNQVPFLSATGCPIFPAPDLTFIGDDPNDPNVDPNDPNYFPTVFVDPNICGNVDLRVGFNIQNSGDLPITAQIPISFYQGSPYDAVNTGTLLHSTTINLNQLQVGDTLSIGDYVNAQGQVRQGDVPFIQFNGPGTTFEMYVVLYNDGSVLPIDTTAISNGVECDITNNFWPIMVVPKPFFVNIDSVDNVKCLPTSPDNGQLFSGIKIGADTVIDLSPYAYQWYLADQVTPIPGATNYNITGLAAGDYYLVINNVDKGCGSDPILGQVVDGPLVIPGLIVTKISDQTTCDPPNGELQADVVGGNAGFQFVWEDVGGPIGVTGPILENVRSGTYTVVVTEILSGCSTEADGVIEDITVEPDLNLSAVDVVNCVNASSGQVSAAASIGGVEQDSLNYRFDWYFYDAATDTRGSILPQNTGFPTVKNLAVGHYEVVITDIATGCNESNLAPDTIQVRDMTFLPEIQLVELAPQTSCDPLQPNGRLQADAIFNGQVLNPATFTFEWFEGQSTVVPHTGGTSGINGQIAENVKGGGQAYTVRITTANQCSVTRDTVVAEIINYPQVSLVTAPNSVCDQSIGFTGSVNSTVTFNGQPVNSPATNFEFRWYNGPIAIPANERLADFNNQNLTQLDSGFYTLVVTNTLLHCPSIASVEQVLSIKALPVITTSSIASTNCDPVLVNGVAQVTDVDNLGIASPNYQFEWYNGNIVAGPIQATTAAYGSTVPGSGLQGGAGSFYTVQVRNVTSGCENTAVVGVADERVIPELSLAALDNGICDPALTNPPVQFSGRVTATVTNQVGALTDYNFVFGGGNTVGVQTANVYDQLDGGPTPYTAVTTHVPTGCVSSLVDIPVQNIQDFPDLTTASVPSTNCVPGLEDGQASVVTVDGGAAPGATYTYAWTGPGLFPVNNGTNNANTHQLIRLQGGAGYDYTVLVTNQSNGCQSTALVNVADAKVIPVLTLAAQNNGICDPSLTNPPVQFSGRVTATVTNQVGALADYSFVFGGGNTVGVQTANIYDQLDGGPTPYTAVTTHVPTGCVSSLVDIPVQNIQDFPDLTTASVPSTNCVPGLEDGQASVVTVDGGAAPGATYTYAWTGPGLFPVNNGTNNANTHQLIRLQGGAGYDYTVLVTNQSNGCQSTALVNVADAHIIPVLTLTPVPTSICDPTIAGVPFDGQVSAAINNIPGGSNISSYFFDWSVGADGNGVNVLSGLDEGTYSVTALHNPTGCISSPYSAQVTNIKDLPVISTDQTPSQNCAGGAPDGAAQVTNVLPNGKTYDYRWFDGNTVTATPDFTDLNSSLTTSNYNNVQGGLNGVTLFQYTVEVTIRETGCINTAIVGVDDDSELPVVTLSSVDNTRCVLPNNGSAAVSTLSYRSAPIAAPYTGFTFAWSAGGVVGPAPGDTYTALSSGNYTITVTNTDDNCTSNPVLLSVLDDLFIPIIEIASVDQTSCDPANPNGSLTATIDESPVGGGSGATAGYSFTWVDNVTTTSTPSNQITNLRGNQTYTISVVRGSTGCTNDQTVTLDENITIPVVSVNVNDLTVCVPPDGSLSASVLPAASYEFFWYDGSDAVDENAVIAGATQSGASPIYAGLIPGNYTVVARDVSTRCLSNQVISTVNDISPAINIVIINTSLPTDCNAINSQMDATANGVTAGYIFDWYADVPQPFDPSLGSINYFTNPPVYTPPATVATGFQVIGLLSGLYTLEVTDQATGCKKFQPHTLPFQNSHAVIKISKTDSELCPYTVGNGSITIEIENPVAPPPPAGTDQTDYEVFLYQIGVPLPTLLSPTNRTTEPVLPFLVSNTLVPGSYTVGVQETYSGSDCFIYQDVIIEAVALDPIISLASSIVSNTACDVNQFDGSIEINVSKDPNDPVVGLTYDIDMVADPNNAFPIVGVPAGDYPATNIGPGTYTFNVTASNGCTASRAYTVLNNPVVSQFVAANLGIADALYCDPLLERNARVIINSISVIGGGAELIADYQFAWDDVTSNIPNVFVAQGDAVNSLTGGDEFANQVPLITSGTVPPGTVKAGTYRVRATKTTDASGTGGIGCTSAPYTINIGNTIAYPELTLTPFGDTSCDPAFFEGSIAVDAFTPSGPGVGGIYTYQWNPTGGAGQPVNSSGNNGMNNLFSNLNDGTYSLTAINEISGCFVSLSTSILKIPPPVFTLTASAVNLTSCGPFDGRVDNIQVFIDGGPGSVADFDYSWFSGNLSNLVIDGLDDITHPVDDQLTLATYPAIALGTYYVKAIRKAGGVGIGCESAPLRRDILDDRIFPQISLSQIENTACDGNFDGQITVNASTFSGPGVGANYDFVWTNDPDGAGPLFSASDAIDQASPYSTPNTDLIGPGSYTVQVVNRTTLCSTSGDIVLQQNTVPMEIVSVTSNNVDVCLPLVPNGSGSVTDVSIGVLTGQSGLFTYTWADNPAMNLPIVIDDPALTLSNLDVNTYYVRARRNAAAFPATPGITGSGCLTAPVPFVVEDRRITPSISLSQIENTACDGNFDGQITVTANTVAGPGIGANYDFVWTNDPDGAGPLFSANDALNQASPYNTPNTDLIGPGSYTVQVTNVLTACTNSGSIVLQQNTVPMEIVSVASTDVDVCLPLAPNGSGTVTDVRIGVTTGQSGLFTYTWADNAGMNSPNPVDDPALSLLNLDVGTYFVRATRNAASFPGTPGVTGSGCFTAPVPFAVIDRRIAPSISLSQIANTACDGDFDGQITVTASTVSGPGVGANYDFVWTNDPDGAGPLFNASDALNQASPYSTPNTDLIGPGSYGVQVTNVLTACSNTGSVVLQQNDALILVVDASKTNQDICDFGGSILVEDVSINGVIDPDHNNFSFTWYTDSPTNLPPIINDLQGEDNLTVGNYPTIQAGTYYVVAKRALGLSGSGCESAPFRVDIQDLSVNPIPALQTFANSSCTSAFLNGAIKLVVRDNSGPGVGALYDYEFNYSGSNPPLSPPPFQFFGNNGNGVNDGDLDSLINLGEGVYNFTIRNQITQCITPAQVTINYDPLASKPNVISVDKFLPTDCFGNDGEAMVTAIRIGSGAPITGAGLLPPGFTYDWFDNSTDAFADPTVPGNIGANDPLITPLTAGTYYVTVREVLTDCRSNPTEVVIDDKDIVYPNIVIQQTVLQLSCDPNDGTAVLAATADGFTDANTDYTFTWFNSLDGTGTTVIDPWPGTQSTVTDLTSGNYSVTAFNSLTNCESTRLFIIPPFDPKFFPKIAVSGDQQTSCLVDNGSVVVRVIPFPVVNGLTYDPPFNFTVDLYFGDQSNAGLNQEPPLIPPDISGLPPVPSSPLPGSFIADPLNDGIYTVRLRDVNTGCIVVETTEIADDRRRPVPKIDIENPLTNCDTRLNGQLSASADGNSLIFYDFAWWSSLTNPPGPTDTLSTQHKLIGQDQGEYFVLITNKASGCDTLASAIIPVEQVLPQAPSIVLEHPQTICWEDFYPQDPLARPNGKLSANVNNETLGYRFDWYTGQLSNQQVVGLTPDTTGIFNLHLVSNTYTVKATILATGCSNVTSLLVPDQRVIPAGIVETTASYCPDAQRPMIGTATLQLTTENILLRQVIWFDDVTNAFVNDGTQIFELPPGFYRAEFLSNEFCANTAIGEVKTEILSYNLVSANGDGPNDTWVIDCISNFPNNKVEIFNRSGVKVYEGNGYDNEGIVFRGVGESGVYSIGNQLPDGTYFYVIDKRDGSKPIVGFLELIR